MRLPPNGKKPPPPPPIPINDAVRDSLGRARTPGQDKGRAGQNSPGDGATKLQCPSYLDVRGKEAWRGAAKALRRKGILDSADGRLLELFASSYSIFRRAESLIKKNGLLIDRAGPNGRVLKVTNPALAIRAKSWKEVSELFASLGIGPIARRKLLLTDSEDDGEGEDAFAVIIRQRNERRAAMIHASAAPAVK